MSNLGHNSFASLKADVEKLKGKSILTINPTDVFQVVEDLISEVEMLRGRVQLLESNRGL